MADVITKSSVFSPTISHHHSGSKNFPIKCSVSVSNRGRLVGISSLRSSFGGVRIAIDQNTSFGSQKRRNYQSIDAKVCENLSGFSLFLLEFLDPCYNFSLEYLNLVFWSLIA